MKDFKFYLDSTTYIRVARDNEKTLLDEIIDFEMDKRKERKKLKDSFKLIKGGLTNGR